MEGGVSCKIHFPELQAKKKANSEGVGFVARIYNLTSAPGFSEVDSGLDHSPLDFSTALV